MEKIMINVNVVFLGKTIVFKFSNDMIVSDALGLMKQLICDEYSINNIEDIESKNLISIRLGKMLKNDKSFIDNDIINNDRLLFI